MKNCSGKLTWAGHVYRDYAVTQAATCTENALAVGTCLDCGATAELTVPQSATGHSYDQKGICTACSEQISLTVDLISRPYYNGGGFDYVSVTVYADGQSLGSVSVDMFYGADYERKTFPYNPHKTYTFVWTSYPYYDDVFFTYFLGDKVLTYGYPEYKLINKVSYTIERTEEHQYERVTTPATCTTEGSIADVCTICGDRTNISAIPATGHSYTSSVTTAPTCTGEGVRTFLCSVCGASYTKSIPATGHRYDAEDLLWRLFEDGTLTITGTGPMYHYSMPENGSEPDMPWCQYRQLITKVVIESGATTIGEYAFHGCTDLTDVTIPESVTIIGKLAFYNCTGLTDVTIPEGVTTIGSAAFRRCSNLINVTLPESVTTIGKIAFFDCTGLKEVTIPESVTSIGEHAFANCTGLTTITFSGAAPTMGNDCLRNVTATAIHPCNDQTWTETVKQSYGGTITWEADHSFGDYIPDENASCTDDGTTTRTCGICGTTETKVMPGTATGHTEATIPGYAPTCTETGLTDGVQCSVCNEVFTAQQAIPAIGHDYLITQVPVPCTGHGYDLHQCQNCGNRAYHNVTAPTGHRYENGVCTVCGDGNITILPGDMNGDGDRTIADVAILYSHIKGTAALDDASMCYADVNGDGNVDIADTARLYAHVKGTNALK